MTSQTRTIGGSGVAIDTTIGYNAANEITSILHQSYTPGGSGGTYSTINSYSYGYDSGGLLTTQTNNDGTFNYSYDKTNQLTGVTGPWNESFSYDLNGNRTMSGYTTGKDNEMLTDAAGNKYTYDANGNTTSMTTPSGDVWTYTWNYRNEMTGFSEKNSSGTVIASGTYTYDSLDRRIGVDETSGGMTTQTWIVYNGNSNTPYAQFNGSGTLLERYLAGATYVPGVTGMVARTNASGVTDWYLSGNLGSVRDIVNTSGTVIDHISYGAFGSIRAETNPSSGSQFKFDGMQHDTITGMYNDWHRGYSASTGRFVSLDPIAFHSYDTNLYLFVENGPINNLDPTGDIIDSILEMEYGLGSQNNIFGHHGGVGGGHVGIGGGGHGGLGGGQGGGGGGHVGIGGGHGGLPGGGHGGLPGGGQIGLPGGGHIGSPGVGHNPGYPTNTPSSTITIGLPGGGGTVHIGIDPGSGGAVSTTPNDPKPGSATLTGELGGSWAPPYGNPNSPVGDQPGTLGGGGGIIISPNWGTPMYPTFVGNTPIGNQPIIDFPFLPGRNPVNGGSTNTPPIFPTLPRNPITGVPPANPLF